MSDQIVPETMEDTGEPSGIESTPPFTYTYLTPITNKHSLEERVAKIMTIGEEVIEEEELRTLLANKPTRPLAYDGFEPSGRMHVAQVRSNEGDFFASSASDIATITAAQGIMKATNVNRLTESGCDFVFWVADWFALMNNKLGGDLKKIQTCGRYMIEVWKAAGMDMSHVKFLWSSEEINNRANEYWSLVMDIARRNSLKRIIRCSQIMGRAETDDLAASQIFYPCMQCADIFFLKADICQLGVDQRKVNMLAREYCTATKRKFKPVIVSHHMLMGLGEGQQKMSKSDPNSAIFVDDTEQEVRTKVKKAFCPPKQIEDNPILDYLKHLVWPTLTEITISRAPDFGGDKTYKSYEEMEADFAAGDLHPGDLKPVVATLINALIEPIRQHFASNPEAKKLAAQVRKFRITK